MHRYYISEMDKQALSLARRYGTGVETIAFCRAENMEMNAVIEKVGQRLQEFESVSLHAPYYELSPCAIDSLIRRVSMHRYTQALKTCQRLGIRRMIVHSGYAPQMYFPQWFVPKSIAFWKEFVQTLPENFELMIENVLDVVPEHIMRVCDGISDPRLRICLDVGHANAYSDVPVERWITTLGSRIAHVHLHNNDGTRDAHNALNDGSINIPAVLDLLDEYAPDTAICIESMDAEACARELEKRGNLHEQSL